jgi:hypothetical protein
VGDLAAGGEALAAGPGALGLDHPGARIGGYLVALVAVITKAFLKNYETK